MSELKIGVIGAGGRGALAREAHRPGKGSRIVAAADSDAKALEDLQAFVGSEKLHVSPDYRVILADQLDAVFVCTPDYLHEEHTVAALEAGKAVYVEKPLSITVEGADHILETAWRTGSKLFVGHNMRYFSTIVTMKKIIDSGAIGNVQAIWCRHLVNYGGDAFFRDWHSERRYSNSLLLQKASHDLDVMHYLGGGYATGVVGMGKLSVYNRVRDRRDPSVPGKAVWDENQWPPLELKQLSPVIDVEDLSMLLLQYDNGVQASYEQCHYAPDHMRDYMVIGDAGRIENHNYERIVLYDRRIDYDRPDQVWNIKRLPGGHEGADPLIVSDFLEFVRTGRQPRVNPVAARYAVAAGACGAWSLRHGQSFVEVPPLKQEIRDYFERGQKR